jgi:thiol-disulfide isomerase/thioredoxin
MKSIGTSFFSKTRRGLLGAAAGLSLVGLGGALAWRTSQRELKVLSEAENSFWKQQFPQIDGKALTTSSFHGKPLVLNFWATWCPPCVEELPLLNTFYLGNQSKGWQILGLAVDQLAPVKHFLTQTPLSYKVALAGFAGIDLSKSLGNMSGGLPFTVVFNPEGNVVHRKIGRLNASDMQAWTSAAKASATPSHRVN